MLLIDKLGPVDAKSESRCKNKPNLAISARYQYEYEKLVLVCFADKPLSVSNHFCRLAGLASV